MTAQSDHPFYAVANLAAAKAVPLALVVLRDGAYIRLTADNNAVLFKRKADPIDPIDRIRFDWSTRVVLADAIFADGPEVTLQTVLHQLENARANPTYKSARKVKR